MKCCPRWVPSVIKDARAAQCWVSNVLPACSGLSLSVQKQAQTASESKEVVNLVNESVLEYLFFVVAVKGGMLVKEFKCYKSK